MGKKKKILFVCTANKQRSRTAEEIYKSDPRFEVKSAGTSDYAERPVDTGILEWADYIIVMEEYHRTEIKRRFRRISETKPIISLDIPDVYYYMDLSLVRDLKRKLEKIFSGFDR
ncbi:MAG TPA: phosphotyrosine protein phosphatase [Spirochaetia bacterium]|nr:phosphotyrosine protein phosphatase [Spirochaetia bacterium]